MTDGRLTVTYERGTAMGPGCKHPKGRTCKNCAEKAAGQATFLKGRKG